MPDSLRDLELISANLLALLSRADILADDQTYRDVYNAWTNTRDAIESLEDFQNEN